MSKSLKMIKEGYFKDIATRKEDDAILKTKQQQKASKDRLSNAKANSSLPKDNASVFSKKPEPDRGPGADRHPNVPRGKLTRPTMENTETKKSYSQLKKERDEKLQAWYDETHGKGKEYPTDEPVDHHINKNIKEDGAIMTAGGAGDPGQVQNPTTNYAFQALKKKQEKIARRKKPVGEEFANGIGNTQIQAGSKKIKGSSKKKGGGSAGEKATSQPAAVSVGADGAPPIGGE
jgi:hypothetical protein